MNTTLTVADARAQLSYIVNPSDANDPRFLLLLNRVCERYLYSGKWKGSIVYVAFPAADGYISLPIEYFGVFNMRYDRMPAPVMSQFYSFMESGPGELDASLEFPWVMEDLGDGYPSQRDIPEGAVGNLRITLTNPADAGKTFRFFGLNGAEEEIFDPATGIPGVPFTSAYPSADTPSTPDAVLFSKLTGIQAPTGLLGSWSLSVLYDAIAFPFGNYRPWETRPTFRRYKTGQAEKAITTICQRRFQPMLYETSWVYPGNITALQFGLQGILYEETSEANKAANFFDMGLQFLNNEAKASRAGARPPLQLEPWGFGVGQLDYTN